LAARISGPSRNAAGTVPDTCSRQIGATTAGETNSNSRHNHGTRHDPFISPP
jgi:hypothetical protein